MRKKTIFCFVKINLLACCKMTAKYYNSLDTNFRSIFISKWDLLSINILSVFVLKKISHYIILAKVYKNNLIFHLKFSSCDVLSFQVNLFFFFWFFWTEYSQTNINLWSEFFRIRAIIFCEISQFFKCEVSTWNQSTRFLSKTIQDVR